MDGNDAFRASTFTENENKARAKRRNLKPQAHASQRVHGAHQTMLQGRTRCRRRITRTVRWLVQLPDTMSAPGGLFCRIAKKYSATKAICLQVGILDSQAPKIPFS